MSSTVLVMGVGSYLGGNYASHLLDRGHTVVGSFSNDISCDKSILMPHKNFKGIVIDIEKPQSFKEIALRISKLHAVNKIVSFWGFHRLNPARSTKFEELNKSFVYNVSSNLEFIRCSLRHFKQLHRIVLTASLAGVKPEKGLLSYSTSKAALIAATKVLSLELAPRNISVNCVSPGWVNSPVSDKVLRNLKLDVADVESQYPMGLGGVSDLFGIYDLLISNESRWITGQNFILDGGRSLN